MENRLLEVIRSCHDLSCVSAELQAHVTDWPSEYHLSSARHNLLRPFPFSPADRILELGCGCGAITRYLGESGARVVALEGSQRRAVIAQERCRDLPNVTIQCSNLMDYRTDERFDYVTLIGVLEYAPIYIHADDPVLACLQHARSFLKENGTLILAIENQLGLKYFNGCDEDHLGKPYYGLHGLYHQDEPTTLGRAVLENRLISAGLPHHRFSYPLPDYKLPQVILSDEALTTPDFDAAALLAGIASRNPEGAFRPNFYENLAWRPIIVNGLLPQLANSFLIVASASEGALLPHEPDWLACTYTTGRIAAYATETRFRISGADIVVEKRKLHPELSPPLVKFPEGRLTHRPKGYSTYVYGSPYLLNLQQLLGRGEDLASVIEWARPWFALLLGHAASREDGMLLLPGDWVDAIPQNLIRTTDGRVVRIDEEWVIDGAIPLHWVIMRGLINALAISPCSPTLQNTSLKRTIEIITQQHQAVDEDAFQVAINYESSLQAAVRGESVSEWHQHLDRMLQEPARFYLTSPSAHTYCHQLEAHIASLGKEISRIKSTVSWRITKPLRLLANLPRLAKRFTQGQ